MARTAVSAREAGGSFPVTEPVTVGAAAGAPAPRSARPPAPPPPSWPRRGDPADSAASPHPSPGPGPPQRAPCRTLGAVSDDRIDVSLARRLIDSQFPQWSQLPITPVEVDGWDNRTFRLGPELTVRLPSGDVVRPAGRQGAALAAGARPAAAAADPAAGGQGRARRRVPVPVVGLSLARRRAGVAGADRRSARLRVGSGRVPDRPAPRRRDRRAGARTAQLLPRRPAGAPTRRRRSGPSTRSATRSRPTWSCGSGRTR